MPNRLARERSPYLLQHAENPVDWFPWGEEAFAKARAERKPIFLSIGYSTCHWCHVMAHESFEDPIVGQLLNEHFVSIKLDREERPDVDRVYMTFVQATTGSGGWPLSVFLTPDLEPFFGGTYFPPIPKFGQRSFTDVLMHISRAWNDNPAAVSASARRLVEQLRGQIAGADNSQAPVAGVDAVRSGIDQFIKAYDRRHGGFGGAPKFPRPSELFFLLDAWALTHHHESRQMVADTLKAMALGGMHDHIGGGFHRYSVDGEWRVPHFEKMLYDQAQLTLAYLGAAQATGDPFFATVAEDTLDYVLAEMTDADGAFYSAEDADSMPAAGGEPREGAFYVFTAAEIDRWFGSDAPVVRRRLGIEDGGNAPSDPHGEFTGQNIPYVAQSVEEIATRTGRSHDEVMQVLAGMRQRLWEERNSRPRPHLDDKVLASWNGLMIASCARAARVLAESPRRAEWLEGALRAGRRVKALLWNEATQTLARRYRDNDAGIDGFCEDYACVAWGALELFEATSDVAWLDWCEALTRRQRELFYDDGDGGWYASRPGTADVLLALKEDYDGAEPAAASVTVRTVLRLGHLTGDAAWHALAQRSLERYGPELGRVARVMPLMLSNVAAWHGRASQVVIVGAANDRRAALEAEVARVYLPFATCLTLTPGPEQQALAAHLPWLAAMTPVNDAPAAYVCTNFTCQAPVTSPEALRALLADVAAPRTMI